MQQKDGVYLSGNGRLVGMGAAAVFTSEAIALKCIQLWAQRLEKRWGASVEFEVEVIIIQGEVTDFADGDAVTLIARARSGCFASNQRVPEAALEAARQELASTRVA